jgi:hypothetical protein
MGIHPFQISDLNWNFLTSSPPPSNEGSYASEFAVVPDNFNANLSRYMKLQAVWANISIGATRNSPDNDSFGQSTGLNDNFNSPTWPYRPNGGYFVRGLWFTNTAIPSNDSTGPFRVGYIGSFIGGMLNADYGTDPNGTPTTVDYGEPVYSHGASGGISNGTETASEAKQWRDPVNPPSDGTDLITNSSSVLTRTAYMPQSYFLIHIDSVGSNTLTSGAVTFHFENRPTLKMAGFNDALGNGNVPGWAGASIPNNSSPYAYPSDPLKGGSNDGLGQAAVDNFHEYYQVTGVRKLNSRGLSFHLAKFYDNGAVAYPYPIEEDGSTLGLGVTLSGNNIAYPQPTVNDQQQYVWAGGRDRGSLITFTSVSANVVTVTTKAILGTPYATGTVVFMQGLTTHPELNGALLTVLAGATTTGFTANWTHANYAPAAENGVATAFPDFRVRQHATFHISEEYYGTVTDTKCAIWSNKASMFPLVFFDLADTWTASVAKRIAGVAVVPYYINATQILSYQVFFLSEDGFLAVYDFTQTNGVLSLGTSAPAVFSTGEAYGALRTRSTTSTITNIAITTNVLTVTCTNTFEVGETVNLQGLTTATFLNNQTVIVASAGGGSFTANYTHANYPSAADTGTAVGNSLWAVYGTMSPDPRLTQTALVNTARVGVIRYLIGSGVWGIRQFSPLTARHNGRSLQEMIVARDSKLYLLVEDVTVTGGGPFNVANAFANTFPSGPFNVNWQVIAVDATVPTAVVYNTSKINGTTLLQYGTNMGTNNTTQNDQIHYWFHNINGQLHDLGLNKIVIQPNWTVGDNTTSGTGSIGLQVLDVSGSTAALANANLTTVTRGTILPNDAFIPGQTDPSVTPVTIVHARDFATSADRTVFWINDLNRANPQSPFPIYLAPPSYNWGAPSALALTNQNNVQQNPRAVLNYQKDFWTCGFNTTYLGQFTQRYAWTFPTMVNDNYIHYINGSAGSDGLTAQSTYGRSFGQGMGFLPTYWKFVAGNWKIADNWADAAASPRTVPAANTNIPLPYGLQVQFGQTGASSYTQHEFHTWNVAWGNTKFARKLRQSYAQFAGQTFTNQETRTLASQNALSMFLIDTDLGTVTPTAPTSATPHTATLTNNPIGYVTQSTWPKLDAANVGFDTTPYQTVWNVNTSAFDNTAFTNPPAANVSGSGPGPYTWTVGATTYAVTANADQGGQEAWRAVAGNPNTNWRSPFGGGTGWVKIDLASAQTVRTYGFRPVYNFNDLLESSCPKNWTLEGSNTGAFAGEQTVVDTQTNQVPTTRSVVYTVGTPGSFRYYRFNISQTQTGAAPALQMLRFNTAALVNTVNFSEMVFYAYGSTEGATYFYSFIRNWQMARGIKMETSINNGVSYTTVFQPGGPSPLWRAHNGYVWTFPRQTNVTNVRITVQHGYNYNTGSNSGNQPQTTGFGPFYFIDYGVSQAILDVARLGSSLALPGTSAAGSFDPNCLGMATDVPNISIDGSNPSNIAAANLFVNSAVHGFWSFDFVPDAAHSDSTHNNNAQFKMHPFFGFTFFQGAGGSGGVSTQTGTNAVINYQWGRRV